MIEIKKNERPILLNYKNYIFNVSNTSLYVIVSYYTSNTCVMNQAFGRTARNGQIGTCRCICLKSELLKITSIKLKA